MQNFNKFFIKNVTFGLFFLKGSKKRSTAVLQPLLTLNLIL